MNKYKIILEETNLNGKNEFIFMILTIVTNYTIVQYLRNVLIQ